MFKRLLDFYIDSSIHVALSVFALVQISFLRLGLAQDHAVAGFGFFGTIVGYNFVKYDAIARSGRPIRDARMRAFIALSFLSFLASGYFFLQLQRTTQLVGLFAFLITALYTLPFFPNKRTARDWAGLKIYFVALCWTGVTVLLPVLNANADFSTDVIVTAVQRFLLIVILLFVFEIIDLAWDDPHLKTVPQQIGVAKTRWLGVLLVGVNICLELFKTNIHVEYAVINISFALILCVFLIAANERRSKYYSTFWVELLPVLWWIALWLTAKNTQ